MYVCIYIYIYTYIYICIYIIMKFRQLGPEITHLEWVLIDCKLHESSNHFII